MEEAFADAEWEMPEPEREFEEAFPDAEWDMAEPEAEPAFEEPAFEEPEFEAAPAEAEHDVRQDVAEPAAEAVEAEAEPAPEPEFGFEPEHQDVADVQPQAAEQPFPQQSEAMRRHIEETVLGQAVEEPAAALSAPQKAAAEPEPPLAGEGLQDALQHARQARGVLDDRAAYQDSVVAETRAAIGELQAGREAAEALRATTIEAAPAVPAPAPVVEVPQIQIQM